MRKKHPLEEKNRLALTGNPNYIADLLKYCDLVKSNNKLKEHINDVVINKSNAANSKVKSFKPFSAK